MENKKTIIGIVISIILIIGFLAVVYLYNDFNVKQVQILTEEANKILEENLIDYNTNSKIKTERNYAKVEKCIKNHIANLKNIYVEMEEMVSGINPNLIFSAQNLTDENLEKIEKIIEEYKEKSQELIIEYEELISEEKILENISDVSISKRKEYYIKLYNEIMLSETMEKEYNKLEEEIKNEKGRLYEKLNKIGKINEFLKENKNSWTIKDNQIQFTNINRCVEYYNLVNQIVID